MARAYWLCRSCGTRNERIKQRCVNASCRKPRPKRRVPKHARTLRDHSYAHYVEVNRAIHAVTDESCGVCGKPRSQERHHDRDHDHETGNPRGLACGGNTGCNVLMLPWVTANVARGIGAAKLLDNAPDAHRWYLIAEYLERVEAFYAVQESVA